MRLIDTKHVRLHEFLGRSVPPYAILSHTWGRPEDEISYADFIEKEKTGNFCPNSKLIRACRHALSESWQWIWIDTCCIDKSSSADLTESINSMYSWYADSGICYIFLADVNIRACTQDPKANGLRESRWFTRGWTLQELLAPQDAVFVDSDWETIGSKGSLTKHLANITGISVRHLGYHGDASIAQKMSWAAHRTTSRKEDIAYSLLGLFNVHMPLIYGEGENAFRRLQEEIIRTSTDQSIFAWTAQDGFHQSGMLAHRPFAFRKSGSVIPIRNEKVAPKTYTISNAGLTIDLEQLYYEGDPAGTVRASLDCTEEGHEQRICLDLSLSKGQYTRIQEDRFLYEVNEGERKEALSRGGWVAMTIRLVEEGGRPRRMVYSPKITQIWFTTNALASIRAIECVVNDKLQLLSPDHEGRIFLSEVSAQRYTTAAPYGSQSDLATPFNYSIKIIDNGGSSCSIRHDRNMLDDCVVVQNLWTSAFKTLCCDSHRYIWAFKDRDGFILPDESWTTELGNGRYFHVRLHEVVEATRPTYISMQVDIKDFDHEQGLKTVLDVNRELP